MLHHYTPYRSGGFQGISAGEIQASPYQDNTRITQDKYAGRGKLGHAGVLGQPSVAPGKADRLPTLFSFHSTIPSTQRLDQFAPLTPASSVLTIRPMPTPGPDSLRLGVSDGLGEDEFTIKNDGDQRT